MQIEKRMTDNFTRPAMFTGVADRKCGLFTFHVDLFDGMFFAKMFVRLRGIVPKRNIEGTTQDTYDIVARELGKVDEIVLKFWSKGENETAPYLVDVYFVDGKNLNSWLIDNGFANKFGHNDRNDSNESISDN